MRSTIRLLLSCWLGLAPALSWANFHLWQISEVYSNASGTLQYVELTAFSGGQQFLNGHTLTSSDGMTTKSFPFTDLPGDTLGKKMLLGTAGLAAVAMVQPDYIVPDGFLFRTGGTLVFAEGFDTWNHGAMPSGNLSLYRNGSADIASPTNFAGVNGSIPEPSSAAAEDLNGDGRSDLLYRNFTTGQIYRINMNGLAVTGQALVYTEANTAWRVIADADFNGDGTSDLLWRNSPTGQLYMQPFNTSGVPSGGTLFYTEANEAWKVIQTPDLDGDGKADLLWRNTSTGQVYAMLMNGASIVAEGLVHTEPNTAWRIEAVGDLAGSGKKNQLVWRNGETGQVYLMTVTFAGGVFSQTGGFIYVEPNAAWKIIGAPDLDGNGKSDLLWRNDVTGQVYAFLMNGASISGEGAVHSEANLAWKIVAHGDYDGDGNADLLWRNDSSGLVYMMRMNGLAIATQGVVYSEPDTAWRLMGPEQYAQ